MANQCYRVLFSGSYYNPFSIRSIHGLPHPFVLPYVCVRMCIRMCIHARRVSGGERRESRAKGHHNFYLSVSPIVHCFAVSNTINIIS